ncbi:MAG: bifunctional riboflavin kinase/FAD synthetase [Candidatus Aminicenantales bacterium]
MKIVNGFHNLPTLSRATALAIGNFDGVHLGHQKILERVVKEASQQKLMSAVLTFFPHPDNFLGKDRLKLIQTLDQRLAEIAKHGLELAVVASFNKKLAGLSGQEFVSKILVNLMRAKVVAVGQNFHFGRNRQGDISLLNRLSSRFNLQVFTLKSVRKEGMIVSSSLIRQLLQKGNIEQANLLLGRRFEIEGEVIKGKSRGKILGFPTANINTQNEIVPPGVFVSEVEVDSRQRPALTNIGYRPTFGQEELNIESYIMNFNKNLYGRKLKIYFIKKIRNEMKFANPEALAQQIKKDIATARKYFRRM